jgi:hypothetical protein
MSPFQHRVSEFLEVEAELYPCLSGVFLDIPQTPSELDLSSDRIV